MSDMDPIERRNYIGASDCAAVLGLSRWRTPLDVWAEKTGFVEQEDISGKLPVKLGNMLEETVAQLFMEQTGKKVRRVTEAFVHKDWGFLRCHIDRKVEGERSILQCKTASAFKSKDWDGEEIPTEYIMQEIHELACSGYDKAYIAVLIGNQDFKIQEITRDEALIKDVVSREVHFWTKFVLPKVMPADIRAGDGGVLEKLYPHAKKGEQVILGDDTNAIIESLEALNQDKKAVESQIAKLKNMLKAKIKENEIGKTGLYTISWKEIHKDAYQMPEQNYRMISYRKVEIQA